MFAQEWKSRQVDPPVVPLSALWTRFAGPLPGQTANGTRQSRHRTSGHRRPHCPAQKNIGKMIVAIAATVLSLGANGSLNAAPLAKSDLRSEPLVHKVAVFEPDDRRLIYDGYPALRERIGILTNTGTQSVCTAFCVAPDVVATAGHCVSGTTSQPAGDPAQLRFRRDGAVGTGISIKGAHDGSFVRHVVTGAWRLNTRPPINASSDWAMLRLSKSACPALGLRLSSRSAAQVAADAANGRIYNIAYHRDLVHWKLAVSDPCSFVSTQIAGEPDQLRRDFERADQLLLHTCDTEAASSGSPLLIDGENGPEVVGINVGTYVRSRVVTHDGQIVQRLDQEVISNTALLASSLVAPLDAFNSGQLLTGVSEIEKLQNYLATHGLNVGPRDGQFGPQTRKAIEIYEARIGLPITGLATQSLLQRLQRTTSAHAEH